MTCMPVVPAPLVEIDGIALYCEPPPAYFEWLAATNAFFDSVAWGNILQRGMGAQRFYLWDASHAVGHALTCFRKGPLRVGYLGFPICASPNVNDKPYGLERMVAVVRALRGAPHLLRVPISAFGGRTLSAVTKKNTTVESCVPDLQAWRSDATSVRRRDLSFARKRCGGMTASDCTSGVPLYDLYAGAVMRHHGKRRYTRAYFEALADMPHESPVLVFSMNDDNGLAGMVLTARHGDTGYYLHGGTRSDALHLGVADLLMARAITEVRGRGAARFDFLPSPNEQAGLIRFKEKWGGVSQPAQTIDVPINVVGRILIWLLG
jgi:hypothetical protein